MRILLIEPDVILAETYITALKSSGHAVVWVRTAQQAVAAADEKRPDLVILELQMSRHNGIEFLYEFKSYSEWQRVPVIVLSAIPPVELEQIAVLRRELAVVAVLGKTQTSLADLCAAVAASNKAKP